MRRGRRLDVVGPVDERFNWHLLYKYVNDALPRPDGTRLVVRTRRNAAPREEYATTDARQAYQMFLSREMVPPGTGAPDAAAERAADNFIKRKLIQVSIEGVASLYADDLPGTLFQHLAAEMKDNHLPGLSEAERRQTVNPAERQKLPRSGWVFEIRGWTYHEKGADFVVNTLVENLATPEAAGLDQKLSKEMKERVKDRLGFVCLYAAAREYRPDPGPIARGSSLSRLVAGGGPPAKGPAVKGRCWTARPAGTGSTVRTPTASPTSRRPRPSSPTSPAPGRMAPTFTRKSGPPRKTCGSSASCSAASGPSTARWPRSRGSKRTAPGRPRRPTRPCSSTPTGRWS